MQGAMRKIGGTLAAVMLSVSCCLFPYSQAAYAWIQVAIPAGYALAAVLATLGIGVAITSDDDASALWGEFELYTDDLDALGQQVSAMQDAAIEAGTASGTLTNVTKQQVSQDEMNAISTMFEAAGNAGSFALDQLSLMANEGVLGILPFILSGFIADQVVVGDMNGAYIGNGDWSIALNVGDASYVTHGLNGINPSVNHPIASWYSTAGVLNVYTLQKVAGAGLSFFSIGFDSAGNSNSTALSGFTLRNEASGNTALRWEYDSAQGKFVVKANGLNYAVHFSVLPGQTVTDSRILTGLGAIEVKMFGAVGTVDFDTGIWDVVFPDSVVTDNPDVIGGSDYWDDAKENKDILNPSAGAAVIGSDAVFDGDYIANRGSITIPTDWSGINSWADALGATHAGVAQGALDGTISGTSAGTAVDVGTGELVNGNVSDLTKPGSNTSIALPLPGLFDGVVDAVSDKFPFCIPGDLYQCLAALSAAPVAPAFDWTFALSHVGLHDVTIRVDLAEFDQVAFILRVGLSVTMTIGLVFLSTRLLNMWGGD